MSAEDHLENCTAFITVWMISFTSRVSFHFLMIFCRQMKDLGRCFVVLKSLFRFIYVCYASGLLKEGVSLLHWLTMILMTLLCINTTIIYPIRFFNSRYLTINLSFILRHAFNGNNFQDILKGRICTKTNLSTIIMDENIQNNFSTKQILMILFSCKEAALEVQM